MKNFLKIYLITISHLNLFILSKKFSKIYLITISYLFFRKNDVNLYSHQDVLFFYFSRR